MDIKFGNHTIGLNHSAYFIADISASHGDGLDDVFSYGLKYPDMFQNIYLGVIGKYNGS